MYNMSEEMCEVKCFGPVTETTAALKKYTGLGNLDGYLK